jgi:hypothetical protein
MPASCEPIFATMPSTMHPTQLPPLQLQYICTVQLPHLACCRRFDKPAIHGSSHHVLGLVPALICSPTLASCQKTYVVLLITPLSERLGLFASDHDPPETSPMIAGVGPAAHHADHRPVRFRVRRFHTVRGQVPRNCNPLLFTEPLVSSRA